MSPWQRPGIRRLAVLVLTVGVVAGAAATVGLAARWRAEAAQLDSAPVPAVTLGDAILAENARAAILADEVAAVAADIGTLGDAVETASTAVAGDGESALRLRQQLETARVRYEGLQARLDEAQARLRALNAAAAQEAAQNVDASTAARDRDDGHEDEDEEEDDD